MLCTVLSAKILMPRIYGRFDAWPVISWVFCDLREKKKIFDLVISFSTQGELQDVVAAVRSPGFP